MGQPTDTTVALLTPPGRGGIAVLLLAGAETARILTQTFRPFRSHHAGQNSLQLGYIVDGKQTIDEAVVHAEADFAEINIHGGPAAATATMELLVRYGARVVTAPAAPAFRPSHPRWNNSAVGNEMLAALPLAKSSLVASAITNQWSAGLSEICTQQSAVGVQQSAISDSKLLRAAADALPMMDALLNPREVVIAGPPNAGKSTLINALIGRCVSIVNETPGTTRDWVRELAVIDGGPIWLTDTAGLWQAPAGVDAEAVRRARRRAEQAHLVVLLEAGREIAIPPWLHASKVLRVGSKIDAFPPAGKYDVAISAQTGQGMDSLRAAVLRAMGLADMDPAKPMAFTEHQASLLRLAADAMDAGHSNDAIAALHTLLAG